MEETGRTETQLYSESLGEFIVDIISWVVKSFAVTDKHGSVFSLKDPFQCFIFILTRK